MKKVIIIGAGPAGLTAAYELLKDNGKDEYEVIVLEESDAIGGISKTVKHNNNRMDIGGHRFFSKDDEVMKWWSTLMPLQGKNSFDDDVLGREKPLTSGGPNPESEDRVMLVRGRVSRIYYLKKFFDYPISMKPETFKNMGFARTVKAGFSYVKSMVFKKEETSLENFYINRFGKVLYGMFFEGYTEKLWGRHPSEIDASWGAQRVKGLSIFALVKDMFGKLFGGKKDNKNVETSLIEQYWYPKYGPGQLWETAAAEIEKMGGKIVKNCGVKGVVCEDNKVTKVVCETPIGEKSLEGDIIISSMPVKDLVEGISGDKPSEEVLTVAKGLPYRDFITVGLLVKRLNLENKTNIKTLGNIVPDCWIYVQEPDVKLGRIQIFNNWSPYMVEDPQNTVWIGLEYFCNEGDEYWNMDDESYIKFAVSELEKMGVVKAEDVLDAHREKVKKAYPAYFDTYDEIDVVVDYLKSINNLYCIGRNGQHRYNNMDHSMVTAMRAVDCIKGKIDDVNVVWNVNTEKEYHEEKQEK
ncbi:MAG: NAD(P)/FAD-dependent oxidoreductase [Clostridia bacterium]|nr:NAD(P)/FAD-dependent oxidoreductase [Clostridia bacterium]